MFTSVRRWAIVLLIFSAWGILRAQTALLAPLDLTHNKPFVMVTINGKGPFRFILDTGTGAEAVITSALATQLDLPVVGTGSVERSERAGRTDGSCSADSIFESCGSGIQGSGRPSACHERFRWILPGVAGIFVVSRIPAYGGLSAAAHDAAHRSLEAGWRANGVAISDAVRGADCSDADWRESRGGAD